MFFSCCCAFFVAAACYSFVVFALSVSVYFVIWFALCRCFIHFSLLLPVSECVFTFLPISICCSSFLILATHPSHSPSRSPISLELIFPLNSLSFLWFNHFGLVWFSLRLSSEYLSALFHLGRFFVLRFRFQIGSYVLCFLFEEIALYFVVVAFCYYSKCLSLLFQCKLRTRMIRKWATTTTATTNILTTHTLILSNVPACMKWNDMTRGPHELTIFSSSCFSKKRNKSEAFEIASDHFQKFVEVQTLRAFDWKCIYQYFLSPSLCFSPSRRCIHIWFLSLICWAAAVAVAFSGCFDISHLVYVWHLQHNLDGIFVSTTS